VTLVKVPLLMAVALVLGACSATIPDHLARPADPNVRVPAVGYRSVTAGAASFRPAEPKDWRELNRQVGPKS
jgi:starvation-inducible outer membrane lipoprotein